MKQKNPEPPQWFNHENYEGYKDLTLKEIVQEFVLRYSQYMALATSLAFEKINEGDFTKVLKGALFTSSRKNINERTKKEKSFVDGLNIRKFLKVKGQGKYEPVFYEQNSIEEGVLSLTFDDIKKYFLVSPEVNYHYCETILDYMETFENEVYIENTETEEDTFEVDFQGFVASKIDDFKEKAKNTDIEKIRKEISPIYKNTYLLEHPIIKESAEIEMSFIDKIYEDSELEIFSPYHRQNRNLTFLKIDLSTPDVILQKKLFEHINALREYRGVSIEQNNLNMVEDDKKSGAKRAIKSIIENRIFQYLDLDIWVTQKGYKPTDPWYKSILFNDKIKKNIIVADSKITQTIKPNAFKYIDPEWIESFKKFDLPSYNDNYKNRD